MRRIAGVAIAAVAVVVLVGQGKEEKLPDLVVRSLVVRSEDGRQLVLSEGALALRDKAGQNRGELALRQDGPCLDLRYKDGRQTLISSGLLLADDEGGGTWLSMFKGEPSLSLIDKAGRKRASLSLAEDGAPTLSLFDEGTLSLFDAKGKVTWKAPR